MAQQKLGRKDYSIAVKTGTDANKFAKESAKGELFFNSSDNNLYIATTTASLTDSTLKKVQLSTYTPPLTNGFSVSLDGTDDYIDTAASLTIHSASVWIKPSSTINSSSGAQVLFSSSTNRFALGNVTSYLTSESIGIAYSTGAFGTGNITMTNSSWTHIFIAWKTSSQTNSGSAGYDFWVNGVLQTTGMGAHSGGTQPTSPLTASNINIGRRSDGQMYYAGLVDEVALWPTDVSADIATIYNSGKPDDLSSLSVVSTAPINWYRMGDNNGGTGATITDQGSSPANGTLNNIASPNGFVTDVP